MYLLDRDVQSRAKVLSNMIKQKRKEKAGKWDVPIPKVKAQGDSDVFKVIQHLSFLFYLSRIIPCLIFVCHSGSAHRKVKKKGMEAYGHQSHLCW